MTLQLVLTADNHLDPPVVAFGPKRFERRKDHMRCFDEVIDYCLRNKPDILLICGDVFDTVRPRNSARARLMKQLRTLHEEGIKTFMVSGHHDTPKTVEEGRSPLAVYGDSGYAYFFEDTTQPEGKLLEIGRQEVLVSGISFNPTLEIRQGPLENLQLRSQGDINIFMVHYPIEGFKGYYGNEPRIKVSSLPAYHLVAAGHIHEHQERIVGKTTVMYPGSTERASFTEEKEEKGFLALELGRDGIIAKEFVKTTSRPMETFSISVEKESDIAAKVKEVIEKKADRELVFRVELLGTLDLDQVSTYRKSDLLIYGLEKFFYFTIDDYKLEIETAEPMEVSGSTSPLVELRRYFEEKMAAAGQEEKEILHESLSLAEAKLQEAT